MSADIALSVEGDLVTVAAVSGVRAEDMVDEFFAWKAPGKLVAVDTGVISFGVEDLPHFMVCAEERGLRVTPTDLGAMLAALERPL